MIKITYVPIDDMKSCRGNGDTAPFILDFDKRWSRENVTSQPLCLQRKNSFIFRAEILVDSSARLKLLKNRGKPAAPVGIVQPAAQSLYRLRHIRFNIKLNHKEI